MRKHSSHNRKHATPSPRDLQELATQHLIAWRGGDPYRDRDLARVAYGAAVLMMSMLPAVDAIGGMQ